MPTERLEDTIHERTLAGVRQVLERTLNHVEGFEKLVVSRATQILQPRIEQRIRGASEEELREELEYLYELLGTILQDSTQAKSRKVRAKIAKRTRRPTTTTAPKGHR